MHKLAIIAFAGLTASAVCMGAAAAIGGGKGGTGLADMDFALFDGKPRCEARPDATATSRTLDWDGGDRAGLAMPGHARYAPGSDDKLHVTGDPQVVAHLRVRDGDIEMDCRGWHDRARDLVITLPGREFHKFDIAGSGSLLLDKLDQSNLKIDVAGSGSVKANGRVDDLSVEIAGSGKADLGPVTARRAKMDIAGSGSIRGDGKIDDLRVDIAGSGHADLGQVTARSARVEINGSGNTDIAPTEEANINISGSGDVNLHSNPKKLETDIAGSGRIHNISPGG